MIEQVELRSELNEQNADELSKSKLFSMDSIFILFSFIDIYHWFRITENKLALIFWRRHCDQASFAHSSLWKLDESFWYPKYIKWKMKRLIGSITRCQSNQQFVINPRIRNWEINRQWQTQMNSTTLVNIKDLTLDMHFCNYFDSQT